MHLLLKRLNSRGFVCNSESCAIYHTIEGQDDFGPNWNGGWLSIKDQEKLKDVSVANLTDTVRWADKLLGASTMNFVIFYIVIKSIKKI